jgi:hypothetical protein
LPEQPFLTVDVAISKIRQLSSTENYPFHPEGEARLARVLVESCGGPTHAQLVIDEFDEAEKCPTPDSLRATARRLGEICECGKAKGAHRAGDGCRRFSGAPADDDKWTKTAGGFAKFRQSVPRVPGVPWEDEQLQRPPKPITLVPGANALWFLTVAHYDVGGLGRALLSLAASDMHQGRFDDARFDRALFVQPAAVRLEMTWVERLPAAVDVHLPGGQMRCPTGGTGDGLALRELLRRSIDDILARLRAAGVTTSVSLDAFAEGGPQLDRLVLVEPVVVRETGPVGADRLPGSSGQYGVSRFDNSTYR